MLKQISLIFLLTIFFCVITFAQENPGNEKEGTPDSTAVKTNLTTDVNEDSEEIIIWNKVCPVKGDKVDEDTPTVEYNGKLYGFCCPGCDTKFAKNPEKYSKNLSEDGSKFIGRK